MSFVQMIPFPTSAAVSSTQWRIYITDTQGAGNGPAIRDIVMRESLGGADLTPSLTTASSDDGTNTPGNATNGIFTGYWGAAAASPQWHQQTFAVPRTVTEIVLTSMGTVARTPVRFDIQYYDGSTWQTYWSVNYSGHFTADTARTFRMADVANYGGAGPYRYMRMTILSNYDPGWSASVIAELEFRPSVGGTKHAGTMTASSFLASPSRPPSNANDGNTGTEWVTTNDGFPKWIMLDMGSGNSGLIEQIAICPVGTALVYAPQDLYVEGSNDGSTWLPVLKASPIANTWAGATYKTFNRT